MRIRGLGAGSVNAGAGFGQIQKDIVALAKGDTFTATVAGVSGSDVTLMLSGGRTIAAKAHNAERLVKGEQLSFTVETSENGQVFVKMSKQGAENVVKIAARALSDAGLPLNGKNLETAKALIENGEMPEPEKLNKATFAMTFASMTFEKLLFFLREGIDIKEANVQKLNDNILGEKTLVSEIKALIDELVKMPEEQRDDAALLIFGKRLKAPATKEILRKMLKREFFMDIEKGDLKEAGGFFKKLHEAVSRLTRHTEQNEETKETLRHANSIKSALEFQSAIKEHRQYMEFPFILEDRAGQGELYIFGDAERTKDRGKRMTALLCLDLAKLGHVEAFIIKRERVVSCTFGLSEEVIRAFKERSFELHKLLAVKGFKLEQLNFEPLDGAFNLLRESPEARQKPNKAKSFSFDAKA